MDAVQHCAFCFAPLEATYYLCSKYNNEPVFVHRSILFSRRGTSTA